MPDANSSPDFTVLSVEDLKTIIAEAKTGAADPLSIAMQIFSAMGDKVTVSGATLGDALSSSAVSLDGPLGTVVGGIQDLSKNGNLVSVSNAQEVQVELDGTPLRLKQQVSFAVAEQSGLPTLDAIAGVSVHKFLWFDMQSIQLKQNEGQKMIRVVTTGGTKEFAVT
jgi:hypothetical protein